MHCYDRDRSRLRSLARLIAAQSDRYQPPGLTSAPQMSMTLVPSPGTTEALELSCTCRFIAHESATRRLRRRPAEKLRLQLPSIAIRRNPASKLLRSFPAPSRPDRW